ncbi:bifunctional transcriptional activator/DNA repair enzyme AdaA [candidate division KSB1 bacterium]
MTIDYLRMEKAIKYLDEHYREQPSLEELASFINLSPFHAQRLFRRWAGISPKRFIQFLTIGYAKEVLEESRSLLDAAFESGLSGPGRLHDLFVNIDAVTPGEFKAKGEGVEIHYGVHPSPFGDCLLGVTSRGICWLSFHTGEGKARGLSEMMHQWKGANFIENPDFSKTHIDKIFPKNHQIVNPGNFTLFLKGTNFQVKVWEALLRIPPGALTTYETIAGIVNNPGAVRAVGSAIGSNPVSYIIPCHRVLRKNGAITGYRWGPGRKKAILAWEAAHSQKEEKWR